MEAVRGPEKPGSTGNTGGKAESRRAGECTEARLRQTETSQHPDRPPGPASQTEAAPELTAGTAAPASLSADAASSQSAAPTSPPTWLAGALAAAGVAILVLTLLRGLRRRAAAARAHGAPKERLASIRSQADRRDELANLMVDVEELTRRFAAQLDNKAARLEILLAEADDKIRRLEAAAGSRARTAPGSSPQNRAAAIGGEDGDLPQHTDPITRDVYRLADEGCSPIEIARRLEQHTGKVELILALRNV